MRPDLLTINEQSVMQNTLIAMLWIRYLNGAKFRLAIRKISCALSAPSLSEHPCTYFMVTSSLSVCLYVLKGR